MKECGMIFNAEMVRAILDGRKTQTRRIIKIDHERGIKNPVVRGKNGAVSYVGCSLASTLCPFGQPGDRLWVRETWQAIHDYCDENGNVDERRYSRSIPKQRGNYWHPVYAESWGNECREDRQFPWRPAIHMPHWASRITLEITDVRVERLNGIDRNGALAEGITDPHGVGQELYLFTRLWRDIYGEDSWQANPFVWVVEFKRVEQQP